MTGVPLLGVGGDEGHQSRFVLAVCHGSSISFSGLTLHRSAVGIHQAIRVDPQEAGLLTGIQDHLDLNGIVDPNIPVLDLYHLGFIGAVELPTEEEFLTDPDVPVFHGLNISFWGRTLHSVEGGLQVRDADLQRLDVERIHSGSKRFSHAFKQGSTVFHRQFVEVKLLDFGLVGFHSYILSLHWGTLHRG